jgi:D-beta-D-heptose 7-phosphate kinase / D-beta-D-heptose 1-phosphate adenosyltransferase
MSNNLFALMDTFSSRKILVIGEAMLDRYLKGNTHRLSQEAPVQVVNIEEKEDIPGGAANTAVNIQSLGAEAIFLSVIGDDEEGKHLRKALKCRGVSDAYTLAVPNRQTLAKQRILANGQMMLRFDQGSVESLSPDSETRIIEHIHQLTRQVDGIIISDYDYGILTPNILKALAEIQQRDPHILVVDAKKFASYRDLRITAIKPNYAEAIHILKLERKAGSQERIQQIEQHGPRLLEIANAQMAAITLDEDGALILERGERPYRIYARPAEHNRVAGAGDTFLSALALALAAGAQTNAAAEIASAAAAIVVEKPGTSTCYIEELKAYFSGDEKYIQDSFQMAARVAAYRRQGKRVVFTNGCFDILHSGHIQYLNQAKAHGDILIVGMNSDRSVRQLKGPNRPINSLDDRARVLSALSCVDHIIPFDEDIPFNLIRLIRPDVFVKGGDYTRDRLPEAQMVEEMGGEVHILPYISEHSTTGIIERIRQALVLETASETVLVAAEAPVKPQTTASDYPHVDLSPATLPIKEPALKNPNKKKRTPKAPATKEVSTAREMPARKSSKIEARKPSGKRSKNNQSFDLH